MAYNPKELSVLAYANGFTLWHYATRDLWVDVSTHGYFAQSSDMFRRGDFVFVSGETWAGQLAVAHVAVDDVRVFVVSQAPMPVSSVDAARVTS